MTEPKLEVGTEVKLTAEMAHTWRCPKGRENNRTARIQRFIDDEGGFKTDRELHGCWYWNLEHVQPA